MEVHQQGPGAEHRWGSNIVSMKTRFCASSVCISLLKQALKLKRHTVDLLLLHIAHTLGHFRDDVPC